jgi:hypothetical protein
MALQQHLRHPSHLSPSPFFFSFSSFAFSSRRLTYPVDKVRVIELKAPERNQATLDDFSAAAAAAAAADD